jgi:hypothetical protein
MDLNQILSRVDLRSEIIVIGLVILAILLILFVNRKRLLERFREWRVQRCLGRIGSEQIRNLVCADGIDGYYNIDRIALTRDAILVISYRPYGGNIYCAERISEWTQVIGQKSFKFENPLFELENQLTALRLLIGNAPLRGFLFFNRKAVFPKGHPDSVISPDNLPDHFLSAGGDPVSAEIRNAWEILKSHQRDASATGQVGVKT